MNRTLHVVSAEVHGRTYSYQAPARDMSTRRLKNKLAKRLDNLQWEFRPKITTQTVTVR